MTPTAPSDAAAPAGPAPAPAPAPRVTPRAVIAGLVLALCLCAMNSYLTLSFGVIEEGPTIAALFFFAVFFLSRTRITTTEMVIVATMGSAGGSFGFIANFYAAKAMTGPAYSFGEMALFGVATSLVGLAVVIPLRELLIIKDKLPWPGSKAVHGVVTALLEEGDPKQPKYLLAMGLAAMFYVVFNNEDGFRWFPAEKAIPIFGLAAYGAAISFAPFALGGSYLMGMRTCVGFLAGAAALVVMAPRLPAGLAETPHRYPWPGIGFLTASGLVVIALNWRVITQSIKSLMQLREGAADDTDRIMSGRTLVVFSVAAFGVCSAVLFFVFDVSPLLILVLVAIGGLLQNLIATRAQAQSAFNPARVMGILLQGVASLFGGARADVNLTGAGFVAGSGAQAGNLTGDMAYGRWFKVKSRWQFWAQAATIIPCALVSAWAFTKIHAAKPLVLEGDGHPAPVAKIWAATALIFDGRSPMPPGALEALIAGAVAGVVYVLLEQLPRLRRWMPCSIGLGLGLVLPVAYGVSFFVGGFLFWIVLGRWLKVRDVTLTTLAVACIVAEGLGGVLKPVLKMAGVIPEATP